MKTKFLMTLLLVLLGSSTTLLAHGQGEEGPKTSFELAWDFYRDYVPLWYGENKSILPLSTEKVQWETWDLWTRPKEKLFSGLGVLSIPENNRFNVYALGEILKSDARERILEVLWQEVLAKGYENTGFYAFSSQEIFLQGIVFSPRVYNVRATEGTKEGTDLIIIHSTDGSMPEKLFVPVEDDLWALISLFQQITKVTLNDQGKLEIESFLAPN